MERISDCQLVERKKKNVMEATKYWQKVGDLYKNLLKLNCDKAKLLKKLKEKRLKVRCYEFMTKNVWLDGLTETTF